MVPRRMEASRYDRKLNGLMIDEAPQMESSTHTVIHKMFTKSCISNQHVFNKYSITYHCFLQIYRSERREKYKKCSAWERVWIWQYINWNKSLIGWTYPWQAWQKFSLVLFDNLYAEIWMYRFKLLDLILKGSLFPHFW